MNEQQIAALVIVGLTFGLWLWSGFRRRREGSGCGGGCGCSVAPSKNPGHGQIPAAGNGGGTRGSSPPGSGR